MLKEFKQLFVGMIVLSLACLASAQTEVIDSFVNLDFDSGAVTTGGPGFKGFDAPDATEIEGWSNYPAGALNDSGVEAEGAWWSPHETNSAFMSSGDAAYNISSYVIQAGDAFAISFMAQRWWDDSSGEWTATLFYDDPENVIGTYVATALPFGWTAYSMDGVIEATPESVGGTLGILFESTGSSFANLDEVVVERVLLHAASPANEDTLIPTSRADDKNDLIFSVYDPAIGANDIEIYFDAGDPNADDLLTTITAPGMGAQTITLETELAADLEFETTYYWRVVGYETEGGTPVSTSVMSFTTVPEVPNLGAATNELIVVAEGADAEITLQHYVNVEEFFWYKVGNATALSDGDDYAGTKTDTLIVKSVTAADEGTYYCKGINSVGEDDNMDEACRVMYKRLVNHYPMESISETTTPDIVDGVDMDLVSIGDAVAVLSTDVADPALGTSLSLANPAANDPNGVYGQVPAGILDYNDMTISSWVKWDGSADWHRVWDFGNDDTQYLFLTPHNGSVIRFAIKDGGDEQIVNSEDAIVVGEWTYIAVTLSGDTAKLYVNGELQGTNDAVTIDPIDIKPALNYIGESQFAADKLFNGSIDDLKIYNYALTTVEIAHEYMDTMGGWVCNNEIEAIPFDFNDDCLVDILDFAAFAGGWLDSNRIYDVE